jgi:hypothetical protein
VALRGKVILGVVGFGLAGVGFLAASLYVLSKVMNGQGLDTYPSGKLIGWNYGAAFVGILALGAAALVAGAIRLAHWWREEREFARLAQPSAKPDSHRE